MKEIRYIDLARAEKEKRGRTKQFWRCLENRKRLLQKEMAAFQKKKA